MKFSTLLKYFLIWQFFIILISIFAGQFITLHSGYLGGADQAYQSHFLIYSRANFDGNHYLSIADRGYGYAQQAFFPLYPDLIRLIRPLVGSSVNSGIIISCLSFLFGLYVFARLLRLDYPPRVVAWTIIALLIFPVSFFFSFIYTEGLFFLAVVSAFYFARTDRYLLAGMAGFLAANTRFIGVFLLVALLAELWQTHKITLARLFSLLLIPAGLLVYMVFLAQTTGDPLAFIHVQTLFNQGRSDHLILLYQVAWRYVKMLTTVNRADPLYMTIILEAGVGCLFFITSVISLFRHRLSYALFGLMSYLIPTLTGSFTSLPRYVLLCFPSFLLLGEAFSAAPRWSRRLFICGSLMLSVVFLSLFIRGYWVS